MGMDTFENMVSETAIQIVLESWKHCYADVEGFPEEFGMTLLIRLFELEPRTKLLFGFHKNSDPNASELGKMALLMRAERLARNLNDVFVMVSELWGKYTVCDRFSQMV